ncbi:hypothetical protein DPEC_G00266930 [Dallia pectoralis]|uniref:Uncharacterized protein n=1 Tax=Dallia pectoralis TaxID=75939 RepID=A0ACC2FNH9_DALPE|nr:hypothetical protein DPEC_G00266930 [Dallia pectoralis]
MFSYEVAEAKASAPNDRPRHDAVAESKIDIPIALGWLFSNSLMARFNMKGKGTKGKTALEKTKVYIEIQDGVMTCDAADTEGIIIMMHATEHLKHHKEVELAETLKTNLLVFIVF